MAAQRARSTPRTRTPSRPRRPAAPAAPIAAPKRREAAGEDLSPAPELSASRKRALRADAHALAPLVHIGQNGIHAAALAAVSRALRDHELIKVRLHEPEDKRAMAQALADGARAALCGLVGHTVILYKPKPKPKPARPAAR